MPSTENGVRRFNPCRINGILDAADAVPGWPTLRGLQIIERSAGDSMKFLYAMICCLLPCSGTCLANDADAETLFVRRVLPLLQEKCVACHGKDTENISGELDLRSADSAMKGGESGTPLLTSGSPETSPIYLSVTREHDEWLPMPPKEADRLSETQVSWIKAWVAGGAPWPNQERILEITKTNSAVWSAEDGITVSTSGGTSLDWTNRRYKPEDLWAWQPVQKPPVPFASPREVQGTINPIDAFIAARMPEGLQAAPATDRRTLIRRATFDLTGLPPAPEELAAFEADSLPDADAFAKVIDRLLESPHYGERMAQHWLDVVRYADSSGFANDYERGNAWRYRDYVVRAFNSDKPYDQFVREQIAGDEIDPDNPEMYVAVGFLRMGPWELTGMEVAKIARQRFLDDVVNSVGETFLAHSLQCARCHDHKFDPIPTRDYYSVQAVFATTQLAEMPAAYLATENTNGFEEEKFLEQRRVEYTQVLKELDEILLQNADRWFAETGKDPTPWKAAVQETAKKRGDDSGVYGAVRIALIRKGVPESDFPPKLTGFTPEQFGMERVARKGLERLRWEMERYEPFALSVYDGRTPELNGVYAPVRMPANRMTDGELENTCILPGGDPFATGESVKPGILSALANVQTGTAPDAIEGRRKHFAEWVASKDNPLTARAIANRIWLWHFDQPIAGNPNNFGSTGRKPTHPELLDWLAATFIEQGWSFKAMHRLIINSEAYRRSSHHPDPALQNEKDPEGKLFAVFRPRRLSGEELRDAMLAATGELNRELGGIPNRPEINLEAALQPRMVMGTFASAWTPNPLPSQRHRRSLYALKLRGLTDPFLEVYNSPAPDFSCERRETSTVTPQVFSLFNGDASHARALALANRVLTETTTDEEAIEQCFMLTLSRKPRPDEQASCQNHWQAVESLLDEAGPKTTAPPLEILRDAVEENTGEKFSYHETLHSNREFVRDLQPADVDRHTRALADVCLVLFNTNEFAYLD